MQSQLIEMIDVNGKAITRFSYLPAGQTMVISTADLPEGLYLVKVAHAKGIATQKLQVLH